uniref:Uncharacterized protein n=1 Tax=Eutreptiella gymnastica TaxID=73025 RepID=A0A7S4FWN3_9EUGL
MCHCEKGKGTNPPVQRAGFCPPPYGAAHGRAQAPPPAPVAQHGWLLDTGGTSLEIGYGPSQEEQESVTEDSPPLLARRRLCWEVLLGVSASQFWAVASHLRFHSTAHW